MMADINAGGVNFQIPKVMGNLSKRIEEAMVLVGNQCVTWAADQWRTNGYSPRTREKEKTGNLVNSLTYSTHQEQGPVGKMTDPGIGGTNLAKAPTEHSVRIGTNVVYAARVEFGFTGTDSLGRNYNQPPKSYLRAGIIPRKNQIMRIIDRAIRG
jgi:phage gpG-like protein